MDKVGCLVEEEAVHSDMIVRLEVEDRIEDLLESMVLIMEFI